MNIASSTAEANNAIARTLDDIRIRIGRVSRQNTNRAARRFLSEPWRIARLLYPRTSDFLISGRIAGHVDHCAAQLYDIRKLGRGGHWVFDRGRCLDFMACLLALRTLRALHAREGRT